MPEKRNPNTECQICQKPIYRRPSEIAKSKNLFCSNMCYGKSITILRVCPVCGKEFRSGENKITCSRSCANSQRTGMNYKVSGRPRKDKVATAKLNRIRLIERNGTDKCETCGYANTKTLQIHHIIERKHGGTDDLENLKLLCPNCHATIHYGDSRLEN